MLVLGQETPINLLKIYETKMYGAPVHYTVAAEWIGKKIGKRICKIDNQNKISYQPAHI